MDTLDNHSAFNREQQRSGAKRRNPNVEVVPTYIIHSRVCRKVSVMWKANQETFYNKFTTGSFSNVGVYRVDKLQDVLGMRYADTDAMSTLEANLENIGYTALENYLIEQLKLK